MKREDLTIEEVVSRKKKKLDLSQMELTSVDRLLKFVMRKKKGGGEGMNEEEKKNEGYKRNC